LREPTSKGGEGREEGRGGDGRGGRRKEGEDGEEDREGGMIAPNQQFLDPPLTAVKLRFYHRASAYLATQSPV